MRKQELIQHLKTSGVIDTTSAERVFNYYLKNKYLKCDPHSTGYNIKYSVLFQKECILYALELTCGKIDEISAR